MEKKLSVGILLVLAAVVVVCIVLVATGIPDASGETMMPDTACPTVSSPTPLPDVPLYDPADFTITAIGPDLSPDVLFAATITLLNNYTTLFGSTVAPVSLFDSSLSEESRNLRNTLSDRALSASPESDERSTGISSVTLTGNETLAAYGFRVLPTGQTVTYAYTVTAGAGAAARAAAARGLNEWMQTVDEMTEVAAASIVSRAAEMDPVEDSGWIAFRDDVKDYGEFGRVKLYSDWYWVNGQNRGYDYFLP